MCNTPLKEISRVPVCRNCLEAVPPLECEYSCVRCHTPFLNSRPLNAEDLCGLCVAGHTRFDAAYSYGFYEGALRELVHLLKYGGVQPLAGTLGGWMTRAVPRQAEWDIVVPMPLHWWKRWRRGFNQADLLAREVGRRFGLPVTPAVRRKKLTRTQTGLTAAGRRRNVAGAFRVCDPGALAGKRILLVDDVLTTGATVNACAGALKSAGAKHVAVLTIARADRRLWVETAVSNAGPGGTQGRQVIAFARNEDPDNPRGVS